MTYTLVIFCVYSCVRFALVCVVFVTCMGPRMCTFKADSGSWDVVKGMVQ